MERTKPPLGVMPYLLWRESVDPEPTPADLLARYVAVAEAVQRSRSAGLVPMPVWLFELFGYPE